MASVGSAGVSQLPTEKSAELRDAGRCSESECFPLGRQVPLSMDMAVFSRPPLITGGNGRAGRVGSRERLTIARGIAECTTWQAGKAGKQGIIATIEALSPSRRTPALERQPQRTWMTTSTPRSHYTQSRNFNGGQDCFNIIMEMSWKWDKVITAAAASANNSPSSDIKKSDRLDIPPPGCSRIKVDISRPLGLVLRDDPAGNIWVDEVVPDGNAERTGLFDVGDQLIATSAVVYTMIEDYNGVKVRKGMEVVRLNVRGEKFDTVMAAIGTHPGHMKVTLEVQKCKPRVNGVPRIN